MKKFFRKIHLWLSVPFGIIITLICFSGAMMVFEKEITEQCRREVYFVKTPGEKPLPLNVLMDKVSATLPDSVTVTGINVSPDPKRTWQATLSAPRRASVYVNQYTGEVTGKYERLGFFDTMFHLHRWLMGSNSRPDGGIAWGKTIVGVSTLLLVLILISGVVIWWPRNGKMLKERLAIHVCSGWSRFWHDLHAAGGIYATIFILVMALTGLTWSFTWYRNGFYGMLGVQTTQSQGAPHAEQAKTKPDGGEATARPGERTAQAARPESERHGSEAVRTETQRHGNEAARPESERGAGRYRIEDGAKNRGGDAHVKGGRMAGEHGGRNKARHWQQAFEQVAALNPGYQMITVSDGTISVVPKGRKSMRSTDKYKFDGRTGEITEVSLYKDSERSGKVRSAVYGLHTGSWGGIVTRILYFLAALLGATLPLTGYYLWIRRLVCKKRGIPHHGPHPHGK